MASGTRRTRPSNDGAPFPQYSGRNWSASSSNVYRSASGGKGMPRASLSAANHPSPSPQVARPPETASSVAMILPRCATGRCVIPATRVPRRTPLGMCRQEREGRVTLQHVVPRRPERRDLPVMIHDPDALEASILRRATDLTQPRPGLCGASRPIEGRHLETEPETHRLHTLTNRLRRCVRDVRRHCAHTRSLGQHEVETVVSEPYALLSELSGLPGEHPLRNGLVTLPITDPTLGQRRRERNADTRHRILTRPPHPRLSPERIETKSIDDGCQSTLRSPLNDLLEQHERVIARRDVILTRTDDGTQRVDRDDLLRFKMRRRPRALPRTRHAHEYHQTRSREHHLRGRGVFAIHHASSVTPSHPCAEERPTRSALVQISLFARLAPRAFCGIKEPARGPRVLLDGYLPVALEVAAGRPTGGEAEERSGRCVDDG